MVKTDFHLVLKSLTEYCNGKRATLSKSKDADSLSGFVFIVIAIIRPNL